MASEKKTENEVSTESKAKGCRSWQICPDNEFNLARHLIPFLQDSPFYSEISRHIQKRLTKDMPTAAVTFDVRSDQLIMYVNPDFAKEQTNWQIKGLITHELDHLIYGHLNERRKEPAGDWNIATDLAINSIIMKNARAPRDVEESLSSGPLPRMGLIPGQRPWTDPKIFDKLSPERQKACTHLSDLIEKLPVTKASEYYFKKLLEDQEKNGYGPEDVYGVIGSMDDHDGWDDVPDEMKEYIEGKIKAVIGKAVRHADSQADGWGNIPADMREEIRRSISTVVNWRAVLRQFVGMLVRGQRTTTIKRINKRYPYIHPGTKRGYVAKLLVAIDESGSVDDSMLEMFFGELEQLTKKVDVTLLHFDCSCSVKDLYEWKKGARPKLQRMKQGGTDFDAPTRLANDPKNRGRWDGMCIFTDGCAPAPGPSRIKRAWVLGQGCKLNFPSNETQIFLTKDKPNTGAWR